VMEPGEHLFYVCMLPIDGLARYFAKLFRV
jgi:hypothetical protein